MKTFSTLALSIFFALAACTEPQDPVVDGSSSSARMEYVATGRTLDVTIMPATSAQKQNFKPENAVDEVVITTDDGVQERVAWCTYYVPDEDGVCHAICMRDLIIYFVTGSGGC